MKTLFGKQGKFKLVVLLTLCAVLIGCAVLLCCTLLDRNNDINSSANQENTTTTIDTPQNIGQTTNVSGIGSSVNMPRFISGGWTSYDYDFMEGDPLNGYIHFDYSATTSYILKGYVGLDAVWGGYSSGFSPSLSFGGSNQYMEKEFTIVIPAGTPVGRYYINFDCPDAYDDQNGGWSEWEWSMTGGDGSITFTIYIDGTDISSATVTLATASYTYDGTAKTPTVSSVKIGSTTISSSYYAVSYSNNINAGTATVTITGKGNYSGKATKNFTINPASLSNATVTLGTSSYTYNGTAKTPSVSSVVLNSKTLSSSTDYTVSYSNNTNAGTATVTITGKGNYTGTATKNFTISGVSLSDATITLGTNTYTYTGTAKTPSVTVKIGSKTIASTHYTVSYSDNINAGTATVTITGNGNYIDTASTTFTIRTASLPGATITLGTNTYTYDGTAKTPSVSSVVLNSKTLSSSTDYTVSYSNNTNAGTATVTITGKGNYSGKATKNFTINPASLSGATVTLATTSYTYDGTAKTPTVSSVKIGSKTLSSSTDYTVSYTNNTNVGTATVTITGKGNYSGTASATFTIGKGNYDMSNAKWDYTTPFTYDGSQKTVTVTGLPTGVTVNQYTNNAKTNVGKYTASVTFTYDSANYNAPTLANCSWEIVKGSYDMSNAKWDYTTPFTYDGTEKTVGVTGLPTGVTVKGYTGNSGTTANSYTATVTFNYDTANYNEPSIVALTWSISKANYDMSKAKWNYTQPFTYDGTEKTVTVSGLPDGVSISAYTGNSGTAVNSYTAKVTLSYDTVNYNEPKIADLTWSIGKANYDMSNAKWDYTTPFTYDGTEKTVSVTGLPTGVTVKGYTGNSGTTANSYTATVTFNYDATNFNEPKISNLNWVINKKTPTVTVKIATGTFYIGDSLSTVGIQVDVSEVTGNVAWTNSSALITGENASYGWTFVPDDTTNYNRVTGLETVNATFKLVSISVSNAKTSYKAYETFDDEVIVVTATYAAGKNPTEVTDFTFTYPGSTQYFLISDDGKEVTIYYTEGAITVQTTVTVSVGKKDYDLSKLGMDDLTVTYDGEKKQIVVTGTEYLPDGLTISTYTYNGVESKDGVINAGTYTVKAIFATTDGDNYNLPELSAELTIGKATPNLDVSGVKTEYDYTGEEQTIDSGATVNSDQEIVYSDNKFTTVAQGDGKSVVISVKENANWFGASKTVEITVNKATLKAEWTGGNGIYDGKVHSATLSVTDGVTAGDLSSITNATLNGAVTVSYTATNGGNADRTKAGTYAPSLDAFPSGEPFCNYDFIITNEDYTFTVEKASAGEIKFEDITVTYDGEKHYITISGELPEEVEVTYVLTGLSTEFDGATEVNVSGGAVIGYGVTAKFTCESGNYEVPEDMSATLTITPKTITDKDVSGIEISYVYNGEAQKPKPVINLTLKDGGEQIKLEAGRDYKVTYSDDNPNAGTQVEVEITGTGNFDGTVTKSFVITKKTLSIVWEGENSKYSYDGSAQGVSAKLDGVVKNDLQTVIPTVTYAGRGATEYGDSADKPVNAGYYTVSVSIDEDLLTNYENFGIQVKNFQIEQAEITVTVDFDGYDPATDTLYMGGALPNLKVLSAKFNGQDIDGEWSWVSLSLSEKATDTYEWQFVPADNSNLKTFVGKITLNAQRAEIKDIKAVLTDDAPEFYVTTTLDTIRNYIIVTSYLEDGNEGPEVKGYSLTCDRFTTVPSRPDVYQLTVSYNGKTCYVEVEYKAVAIIGITVTPKDPTAGIKKDYEGYGEFDRTSIIVTAERNDGYSWVLADDEYTVEYVSGKGFFCVGETYVTISYGTGADRKAEEIDGITVERAEFILDGVTFNGDTVTFDGNAKTVSINGVFNKGTVNYDYYLNGAYVNRNEGVTDAGEYTVKATFTFADETDRLNYKPISLDEVTLTIEKAVYADIRVEDITVDYNGSAQDKLIKIENLPEGDEVKYTITVVNETTGQTVGLENIKNAGTYTITVHFTVDKNHVALSDKVATFKIEKATPQINPTVGGNFTQGVQLKKLLLVAGDGEIEGTYEWLDGEYELIAGINRCYFKFIPTDTANYKEYTSSVELTAVAAGVVDNGSSAGTTVTTVPDWATYVLVAVVILVLIVALIALIIALKSRNGGDNDGFYDTVSDDQMS